MAVIDRQNARGIDWILRVTWFVAASEPFDEVRCRSFRRMDRIVNEDQTDSAFYQLANLLTAGGFFERVGFGAVGEKHNHAGVVEVGGILRPAVMMYIYLELFYARGFLQTLLEYFCILFPFVVALAVAGCAGYQCYLFGFVFVNCAGARQVAEHTKACACKSRYSYTYTKYVSACSSLFKFIHIDSGRYVIVSRFEFQLWDIVSGGCGPYGEPLFSCEFDFFSLYGLFYTVEVASPQNHGEIGRVIEYPG